MMISNGLDAFRSGFYDRLGGFGFRKEYENWYWSIQQAYERGRLIAAGFQLMGFPIEVWPPGTPMPSWIRSKLDELADVWPKERVEINLITIAQQSSRQDKVQFY